MGTVPDKATWVAEALARWEKPLLRFAVRLCRREEDARDVVQETFVRLCQADRAAIEGHLAPWLHTVCRNVALDLYRKERRVEPLSAEHEHSQASKEPPPSQVAEERQGVRRILACLSSLPESQQEVLRLKFQSGLSYKEISEVTGHSVSHVGVLLHHAIRRLRELTTQDLTPAALAAGRNP